MASPSDGRVGPGEGAGAEQPGDGAGEGQGSGRARRQWALAQIFRRRGYAATKRGDAKRWFALAARLERQCAFTAAGEQRQSEPDQGGEERNDQPSWFLKERRSWRCLKCRTKTRVWRWYERECRVRRARLLKNSANPAALYATVGNTIPLCRSCAKGINDAGG